MQGRLIAGVVLAGAAIGFLIPSGAPEPVAAPPAAPLVKKSNSPADTTAESDSDTIESAPRKTVLQRGANGHFFADAMVNGQSIHFVVDTGATTVALTMDDARKLGLSFDPSEFEVIGRGASGDVRGKAVILHHVAIDRQEGFDIPAVILGEGLDVSLLGQSWLGVVDSVQISGDTMTLG
jgi:aspartyl protease family protein